MEKNNISYVIDILKRFGIFIYIGNKLDELVLMESEIQELYSWNMITDEEYIKAINMIKKEFLLYK